MTKEVFIATTTYLGRCSVHYVRWRVWKKVNIFYTDTIDLHGHNKSAKIAHVVPAVDKVRKLTVV